MTINLTARNLALGGISLLTADAWNLCEATIIVHEFVMLQEFVILDFLPPSIC